MKKSKKLLSVILAILMLFSTMSVMASAYADTWTNMDYSKLYNSNDKAMSTALTDEERAAYFCDLIDSLLASANINEEINIVVSTVRIDLRSINALGSTLNSYGNLLGTADTFYNLGVIADLNFDALKGISRTGSDVGVITKLLAFIDANAGTLIDGSSDGLLSEGGLSLGKVESAAGLDLSAIKDLPTLLKKTVYGLGVRSLTNGIGADPEYPNDTAWDDLATKPTLDAIVQDLLVGLITEPSHTTNATAAEDNLILTNPEAYGATAAMIHQEADTGYYYIYGMQNSSGNWLFSETGTDEQKQYITHWDISSALMPDFDTSLIDFTGTSLYTLLAEVGPIIYDAYGQDGLNGKLRATLMQWCGAVNTAVTDEAEKAAVLAEFQKYLAMNDADYAAEIAKEGIFGTRNFMYFPMNGATYYCVEWEGSYELYKVNTENVNSIYGIANWDYQVGTWDDIWKAVQGVSYAEVDTTNVSFLKEITDIMGYIVKQAIPSAEWTMDAANETNAHFEENITKLIKQVISMEPEQIFGRGTTLPENFASFDLEDVAVMIAKIVIGNLMPSLILPESVDSVEEILVYGVREFIAEIMPEYSWDDKIDAAASLSGAAKEDAYLEIALSMGSSIACYYVRETMGYTPADMSPNATWQVKLDGILEFILDTWVPGLTHMMQARNATVFATTDVLDKLSIIANSLFPNLLSLIGNCSGTVGDGTTANCTVDLKNIYNLVRGLLNGEVEPIANKLYRNTTGAGNLAVYPALITLVEDLVEGLGFNGSPDYANLKAGLDTALNSATPLDTLVSRTTLATVLKTLLWTISDVDDLGNGFTVTQIWPQDALRIVLQVAGVMDEQNYDGSSMVINPTYIGSATATITPSITFSTKGLPMAFYEGGYGTGTLRVDGEYTATLTRLTATNYLTGAVVADETNLNRTLTNNQAYTGASITVTAPEAAAAYRVTAYFTVTAPNGTLLNDGEPLSLSQTTILSSQQPGDDVTPFQIFYDNSAELYMTNTYIDENTALVTAERSTYIFYNTDSGNRNYYIKDYGSVSKAANGAVTLKSDGQKTSSWTKTVDGIPVSTTLINDQTSAVVPFYWYANQNNGNVGAGSNSGPKQLWLVDETIARSAFPDDFTVFTMDCQSSEKSTFFKEGNGFIISTGSANTQKYPKSFTGKPQVILYNSYGLEAIMNSALSANLNPDDYTAESWAAYTTALGAAIEEWYLPKSANGFRRDHTELDEFGFISDFQICAEALTAARENLVRSAGGASTGTSLSPEEQQAVENLKTTLDAEFEKGLDNKDFYAYRWWLYYNKRAELNSFYYATQAPKAINASTQYLAGVADEDVAAVLAATERDAYATYINALVKNPTEEQIAANAEAIENFTLPVVDTSDLQIQIYKMNTYASRLLEDGAYKYYLNDAIETVTALIEDASVYTAQSYAAYTQALAAANTVNADEFALASEIHKARYAVLVAYNNLVKEANAADFTELNAMIAQAQAILDNADLYAATAEYTALAEGNTTTTALAELLANLGYKVELDAETSYVIGGGDAAINYQADEGKYEAKDQVRIDWIAEKLQIAMANLECTIKAIPVETVENPVLVDNTGAYLITGVVPGTMTTAGDVEAKVVVNDPTSGALAIEANEEGMYGTGAKAKLTLTATGATLATYTVVVYGDVNGDGVIDAFDTARMNLAVEGGTSLAGAYRTAGGLTTGEISAENYSTIKNAAVGAATIAQ